MIKPKKKLSWLQNVTNSEKKTPHTPMKKITKTQKNITIHTLTTTILIIIAITTYPHPIIMGITILTIILMIDLIHQEITKNKI